MLSALIFVTNALSDRAKIPAVGCQLDPVHHRDYLAKEKFFEFRTSHTIREASRQWETAVKEEDEGTNVCLFSLSGRCIILWW